MSSSSLNNSSGSSLYSSIVRLKNYGFSCELRNLSSLPCRNLNVLFAAADESKIVGSILSTSPPPPTTTVTPRDINDVRDDYDYEGALIYIIFILGFYSLSVILMILIQTKKSEFYHLDESNGFDGLAAQNVIKRFRSQNVEREALEDLRDVAWREKLWSIYTTNPNNYKIRRFESKRVQQIDRKLRQYYAVDKQEPGDGKSSQKESHYRTFDPGQLDNRSSFRATNDRHSTQSPLLLLKDLNKFEYQHSTSVPAGGQAPITPPAPSSAPNTSPSFLHPNQNNSNQVAYRKMNNSNDSAKNKPKMTPADLNSIPLDAPPGTKPNRFTVEKIKDDMV